MLVCPIWTRPSRCVCQSGNMEHPKAIGDRSTLAIMIALQAAEIPFFLPFGENSRCDLVIDYGGSLAASNARRDAYGTEQFGSARAARTRTTQIQRCSVVTISPTSTTSACTAERRAGCTSFQSA